MTAGSAKNRPTPARLLGMTWDHPRGNDPLVGCSHIWREKTGVEVAWERRSLQDFESYPLAELAERYDLIVLDHPHVGQVCAEGCLVPLDTAGFADARAAIARGTVGPSYESYVWRDRLWALPIDAAAQVQAWRTDLIDQPATRWPEVVALARRGVVACPLRSPHSLMLLFTLCANLGEPCHVERPEFIDPRAGAEALRMIRELVAVIDPACLAKDPIAVLEEMSAPRSAIACVPFIYGYVSYARNGFRPRPIRFADIPAAGSNGPVGSALGGTGMGVSARSRHFDEAARFAYWVASGAVQRGPYAEGGGQPAHADAWSDPRVNAPVAEFYAATRTTLEGAWVRPRHEGYVAFQHMSATVINRALVGSEDARQVVTTLNTLFRESLAPIGIRGKEPA